MRKPREYPEDNPDEEQSWSEEEAPEKYEAATMGDNEDQDDEDTLAIQADARDTVEPKAPALRTRGRPARVKDVDTREDAGAKLDPPTGTSAELNPSAPARPKRASGRPNSSRALAGKRSNKRSQESKLARSKAKKPSAVRNQPKTRGHQRGR